MRAKNRKTRTIIRGRLKSTFRNMGASRDTKFPKTHRPIKAVRSVAYFSEILLRSNSRWFWGKRRDMAQYLRVFCGTFGTDGRENAKFWNSRIVFSSPFLSIPFLSFHLLPCPVLTCPVLPNFVLFVLAMSCLFLSSLVLYTLVFSLIAQPGLV